MRSVVVMLSASLAVAWSACSLVTNLDDLHGSSTDAAAESADATVDDAPTHTIAFVQAIGDNFGSTGLNFGSLVTEGNAVIVVVANSVPGVVTVSDTQSNSYTTILPPFAMSDGGTLSIFVVFGAKGGFRTMHVTPPDGGTGYIYYAAEYSGITKFDNYATGNTQSTGTDALVTSSIATTAVPELLFAYAEGLKNVEPGSTFTPRSQFDGNTIEDRIVNAAGSYQGTATLLGGDGDIVLACFH